MALNAPGGGGGPPDAGGNADPPRPRAAAGSETKNIPIFTGETDPSAQVVEWVHQVDDAMTAFRWTNEVAATVAKGRLAGVAMSWLRSMHAARKPTTHWRADANANPAIPENRTLRYLVLKRFRGDLDVRASAEATRNLRQKPKQSTALFLDEVQRAVDLKFFHVPEAEKDQDAYKDRYDEEVLSCLSNGIRQELYERTYGVGNRYNTYEELANACMAAEDAIKPVKSIPIHEVGASTSEGATGADPLEEMKAAIEEIRSQFGRRKGGNECYRCGRKGHWSRDCTYPPKPGYRPPQNRQGGQGGQGAQGGQNRGGRPRFVKTRDGRQVRIYEITGANGETELMISDHEADPDEAGNA